jgi:hypothetical protein
MTRVILGILRKAAEPMTTRDVAMQMLIERGLDSDDVKLLRVFRGRVNLRIWWELSSQSKGRSNTGFGS